jgi:hypothetical protein
MGRRSLGPDALSVAAGPRFTAAEFDLVRAAAARSGLAPATWLRGLALAALASELNGPEPAAKLPLRAISELRSISHLPDEALLQYLSDLAAELERRREALRARLAALG